MWKWILATVLIITASVGTSLIGHGFTVSMVGFWPSLVAILLTWGYLLITALYFLEAVLARPYGANVFNISRHYFGRVSACVISIIWLFILIGTLGAFFYLTPSLATDILSHQGGITIPPHWMATVLLFVLGVIFCSGVRFTLIINLLLALGLGWILYQSYHLSFAEFNTRYFKVSKLEFLILVFPILTTSLYYHFIIPTVASFLNNNIKQIRSCLITGSLIAAVIFVAWCAAVSVAADKFGPENLAKLRLEFLNYDELSQVPIIGVWMPILSFISMVTIVLAVGLSIIDFFGDLFKVPFEKRRGFKRMGLIALALIPAYSLTAVPVRYTFNAMIYLTDFAGLFVTGLFPTFLVWSLRHSLNEHPPYTTPGGNITLAFTTCLACFAFYLLGIQITYQAAF